MSVIYLDHHATTPLDKNVLEAMLPFYTTNFGNASSQHKYGWSAKEAVEAARQQVSKLINARAQEIYFTSTATESNNLALLGLCESYKDKGRHIITTTIEHKSVLNSFEELKNRGFETSYISVDSNGNLNMDEFKNAIREDTILVSIQSANNEVGTIQNLKKISELIKGKDIFIHSDLTQSLSTMLIDVNDLGLDLASFTAHKMYGPKGAGALYVRTKSPRIKIKPQIFGGTHEKGLRPGTLNVPAIVGFGKACEMVQENREKDFLHIQSLRDYFQNQILEKIPNAKINGEIHNRLPFNLSVTFEGLDADSIAKKTQNLAFSAGAACTAAQIDTSHVLKAIGRSHHYALSTLRFGLGRSTSRQDIEIAVKTLVEATTGQQA